MTEVRVWSWRGAVQSSRALSATTKLVLFNLSVDMNENGGGCFPSTKRQAEDTGLSERSVCTHLELAEKAGFIKRKVHGYGGQNWKRHEYYASYPEGTELRSASGRERTEPVSAPIKKGTEPNAEGTEPNDKKALKDVQSTTTDIPLQYTTVVNPPKSSLRQIQKSKFVLPAWIPKQDWDDFLEVRRKKKAPSTDRALNAIVQKLDEFRSKGHDPTDVLLKSIVGGWAGVFEPKDGKNGEYHSIEGRSGSAAGLNQRSTADDRIRNRINATARMLDDLTGN